MKIMGLEGGVGGGGLGYKLFLIRQSKVKRTYGYLQ